MGQANISSSWLKLESGLGHIAGCVSINSVNQGKKHSVMVEKKESWKGKMRKEKKSHGGATGETAWKHVVRPTCRISEVGFAPCHRVLRGAHLGNCTRSATVGKVHFSVYYGWQQYRWHIIMQKRTSAAISLKICGLEKRNWTFRNYQIFSFQIKYE